MSVQEGQDMSFGGTLLWFGWLKGMRILTHITQFVVQLRHKAHQNVMPFDQTCQMCMFQRDNPGEDSMARLFESLTFDAVCREWKFLRMILLSSIG